MKRFVWVALSASLALTACEIIRQDGLWESMKWSHPKYETVKTDGVSYYLVPVEGGNYGFRCKNYSKPWLSNHTFVADGSEWHSWMEPHDFDMYHYENEWCKVDAADDSVKIHFEPNTGLERRATIRITAGDIFDSFSFLQQSAPELSL